MKKKQTGYVSMQETCCTEDAYYSLLPPETLPTIPMSVSKQQLDVYLDTNIAKFKWVQEPLKTIHNQ
jgi:hypothetical protein